MIDEALRRTLNRALLQMEQGAVEEAADLLEPLAARLPVQGDLARVLGVLRLIQGRDREAERLHVAAGQASTGLGVALQGVTGHAAEYDFLGTVVIPVHGMAGTIGRALDSVAAAARFLRARAPEARVHLCVVDDASPDDTAGRVLQWGRSHPELSLALIANTWNRGAGHSRNAGAAAGFGRYLWFLDADDYFLEPHLFLTARALEQAPEAGFVRTAIRFDAIDLEITPAWRQASENCYPCNLCVRRVCHDMTGGFPEEAPFRPAFADDVVYARALHSLFGGIKIAEKTVHYTMRADNALSRQRLKMIGAATPDEPAEPDTRFMAIEILTQRRLYALKGRRAALSRDGGWTGPPVVPPSPRPERAAAAQAEPSIAVSLRAVAAGPGDPDAWFELGLQAHRRQRRDIALRAFRAVARLRPDAAAAWFNLGAILFEIDALIEAALRLRVALALQPGHANTLSLLGRIHRRLGQTGLGQTGPGWQALGWALRLDPGQADFNADYADAALDRGDAAAAAAHGRRALQASPGLWHGHAALAAALEALGRGDRALAAWERAIRCNPGFGEPFTRRALILLARRWGPPPPAMPTAPPGRRLASTALGRNGRFGNQLLQYGALRLCAARRGLVLETPPWLGRQLYDLRDPLPGPALPRLPEAEGEAAVLAALDGASAAVLADRDLAGYFCGETGALAPFKEEFRAFFTPGRHLRPHADAILDRLREAGRTIVALHLRRGDFGWGRFWIAPDVWYLRWLETLWPTLVQPALFIATDDPACLQPFAAYRPLTGGALAEPIAGAEFFTDFHVLCHADHVAISNSTFSFVATMLNRNARSVCRPDPTRRTLVPYDPWSARVLI
jgi:tetratricopeptide (TPR) repeat protein